MQAAEHVLRVAELAHHILISPSASSTLLGTTDAAAAKQIKVAQFKGTQNNKDGHGHYHHHPSDTVNGEGDGDLSRSLMLEAVARTLAELDPSGTNRLTGEHPYVPLQYGHRVSNTRW
jgi:hypothetical protein